MILVLFLTVGYQFLLNEAFGPFIKYLPITYEGVGLLMKLSIVPGSQNKALLEANQN